jgi:DNA-binding transcriptional LysR family regulator
MNNKNIPTDLLRTFLSVVELRSYTRAAKAQGVTQPAVSAQIRRLQSLLEVDLLDKSAPGVTLTSTGELIVNVARRVLALNDQIVQMAKPNPTAQTVRIGVPGDCMGTELECLLADCRMHWPYLRFAVQGGGQHHLLQGLKDNEFDLVVALVIDDPGESARHCWTEELCWVRGKSTVLDPDAPVPLVAYREICVAHRIAASSLNKVGRASELMFRASNAQALISATAAGCGVMAMPRRRVPPELEICDDGTLPPLPAVYCGVFVREESELNMLDQLADRIAEMLHPTAAAKDADVFA